MNKRRIGKEYEDIACKYLINKGHKVIKTNFLCGFGEIDIISKDKDFLVFTEVKYRNNLSSGFGEEAVNSSKQSKIYGSARYFLYKNHYNENTKCRFDVIAINNGVVNHIENAFGIM